MTLTLLLDLDDTLIVNPIDAFLESYLKAFARHLNGKIAPDRFVQELLAATQIMIRNEDPTRTLEDAFDAAFYPSLGLGKTDLIEVIESFYRDVFPTLRTLTRPKPEAVRVVQQAFEKGYRVAVATNPLFPRTAILQRLSWAGLPPQDYPFDLICSYETFHFAKPNPSFFSEVMAQLGWPSGPAVMVGNSLADDILPAVQAGLRTFYLTENETTPQSKGSSSGSSGRLEDLPYWLENLDPEGDSTISSEPAALISQLRATPAALRTITNGLSSTQWKEHPLPDEWGPTEIACHLRDVEGEVNLRRIMRIVEQPNPFIPGEDTDVWAAQRHYELQDGPFALERFIECRSQVISILKTFQAPDWENMTRHAIFGPTRVKELVNFIASHDRAHLQQMTETLRLIRSPEDPRGSNLN